MLDRADFALQEQPEDNLIVPISRAWYNGSYTMAAKPIRSLELHYTMIQFLIITNTLVIAILSTTLPSLPLPHTPSVNEDQKHWLNYDCIVRYGCVADDSKSFPAHVLVTCSESTPALTSSLMEWRKR